VRRAGPGDAAAIAAVKIAAWRAAYRGVLPDAFLDGLDAAAEESAWRAYLEAIPAEDRVWVVVDDGTVVGYARTGPSGDSDLPAKTGEVHGLYVSPSRLGTGRGRELFKHAVNDLAARGYAPVVVWHFTGNDQAARFYERAAFRLDGAARPSDFGVEEVRRRGGPAVLRPPLIRPAEPGDAEPLHELRVANRAWLEPSEPDTEVPDERFRLEYERVWVTRPGRYVILDDGEIAGALSLVGWGDDVLKSAMLGYWVDRARAGRGLATAAVREALELAFGELGMHRVEAGTLIDNVPSQRVLEKCGFTRVGVLRGHLKIKGEWRDHYLYERLATDP